MDPAIDTTGFLLLAFALYAIGAGLGEFRSPGMWLKLVGELEQGAALRLITGIMCLAIGTPLYLYGSWASGDWAVWLIKFLGGWMIVEGFIFLAFGEWLLALSRRMMGAATRAYALFSILLGLVLGWFALARLV